MPNVDVEDCELLSTALDQPFCGMLIKLTQLSVALFA
jgi:hypothetical protein